MKPATPLPWVLDGAVVLSPAQRAEGVGIVADCNDADMHRADSAQNAAYIVHAANQLPRAIACLKRIAERPPVDNDDASHETATELNDLIILARDCLRELGAVS